MSRQHKLYDYQVTPPADAWEHIAGTLDELQQLAPVSKKLQDAELPPPPEAWEHIAGTLEELQQLTPIGRKLEQIEVTPPVAAWNRILDQLEDNNRLNQLSEKLKNLAIAPPAALWSKIEAALPGKAVVPKPAPVKTGSFKWTRYAVAASVIGLLCFATLHLLEKFAKNRATALAVFSNNQKKDNRQTAGIASKGTYALPANGQEADSSVEGGAHLLAQGERASNAPTQIRTATGHTYHTTIEKNKAIQGRYIILMTQDGNVVRMSKKLGNIADCVSGETAGSECTSQIQEWQKELANAPVTATPDTFLDLLDLAKTDLQSGM